MHNNSLKLFQLHGLPLIKPGDRVLEVGPDWAIPGGRCRPLVLGAGGGYHHTDIEPRYADQPGYVSMSDEYHINVEDGVYDVVFALSVIEHVRDPFRWTWELARVTEVGGHVVLVNPLSWPYHPSPYDCWRILPDGFKVIFEAAGLEHVFSWTGNVAPLEGYLRGEHGPHEVTDTIAVGRVL